jgi:hypothetical protein
VVIFLKAKRYPSVRTRILWVVGAFLGLLLESSVALASGPLDPFLTPGLSLSGASSLVGETAGTFDVGSNGSATYRIPLALPPGKCYWICAHPTDSDVLPRPWLQAGLEVSTHFVSKVLR